MAKTAKKHVSSSPAATIPSGPGSNPRRIKCACARCECTLELDKGVRKGNLVYCSEVCSSRCTVDHCLCDHGTCATA